MVAVVNPWVLVPTLFVSVVFYYLRNMYLCTSQSVRKLESVGELVSVYSRIHFHMDSLILLLVWIKFNQLSALVNVAKPPNKFKTSHDMSNMNEAL